MSQGPGIDERRRERLLRAGRRFRKAQDEHRAAVEELKSAVVDADGMCAASDVADLTGVSSHLLEVLQPQLRSDPDESEPIRG